MRPTLTVERSSGVGWFLVSLILTMVPLACETALQFANLRGDLSFDKALRIWQISLYLERPSKVLMPWLGLGDGSRVFHSHTDPSEYWDLVGLHCLSNILGWYVLLLLLRGLARKIQQIRLRTLARES